MSSLHDFETGGYRFLRGGFPYSQGVIALPRYAIVHARFARPLPVGVGFEAIAAHLRAVDRPLQALCAAELRSPQPFSLDGFRAFNTGYVAVLQRWGLVHEDLNPVARSNVCPAFDAPAEPSFFAFAYTVPAPQAPASFVVAGSGEWPEDLPFPDGIVGRGDVSPAGLSEKARYVLQTMRKRTAALGGEWSSLTAAQVYTVHDIHPLLATHFATHPLTRIGITWFVCRPPIVELEFEMDVRSVAQERVLPAD